MIYIHSANVPSNQCLVSMTSLCKSVSNICPGTDKITIEMANNTAWHTFLIKKKTYDNSKVYPITSFMKPNNVKLLKKYFQTQEFWGYFKNLIKFASEEQFVLLAPDLKVRDFVIWIEESFLIWILHSRFVVFT